MRKSMLMQWWNTQCNFLFKGHVGQCRHHYCGTLPCRRASTAHSSAGYREMKSTGVWSINESQWPYWSMLPFTTMAAMAIYPIDKKMVLDSSKDHAYNYTNQCYIKLDESMARRQLKSPRSLSGRSLHLTLVTKRSWSWSWMTYCYLLCAMSIGPHIVKYSYIKIWPWKSMVKVMCLVKGQGHVWPSKFKGQGYGQGQTHWSHLRPGVQSICLLFVTWQSDHFWQRYSKFYIWPWKFKVKVMAKVKPDGHIWALEFNRYVSFSFRGNRTIVGWDIANSIFDLENSRSRSWPRSNSMVTFEP